MRAEIDDPLIGEFTHGQGLILALPIALVFAALVYLDLESIAKAALSSLTAICCAVWIYRPSWRKVWFWVVIGALAIAHVAFVLAARWPMQPGTRIAPLVALDVIATLFVVALTGRLIEGRWS